MELMLRKVWVEKMGGPQAVARFAPHLAIDTAFRAFEANPSHYGALENLRNALVEALRRMPANTRVSSDPTPQLFEQVRALEGAPVPVHIKDKITLDREKHALNELRQEARQGILWLFEKSIVNTDLRTLISDVVISTVKTALAATPGGKVLKNGLMHAGLSDEAATEVTIDAYKNGEIVNKALLNDPLGRIKEARKEVDKLRPALDSAISKAWDAAIKASKQVLKDIWEEYKALWADKDKIKEMIIDLFFAELIPQIVPVMDSIKACIKAIPGIIDNVVKGIVNEVSNKAKFQPGFSSEVRLGVAKGVTLMAIENIADFSLGAASLGLTIAGGVTAALKPLIKAIYALCKGVIKFVIRLFERSKLKNFCDSARLRKEELARAITQDPARFDKWFGDGARFCPSIPMVVMASHFTGNGYAYLSMYDEEGRVIDADTFQSGEKYRDWMKDRARAYMAWSEIKIVNPELNLKAFKEKKFGHLMKFEEQPVMYRL